jgi:hypothetical protein
MLSAIAGLATITYVLQAAAASVPLGQTPGLRLSVTNDSRVAVSHVLEPASYEVRIDGPGGHRVWFYQTHIMPASWRLDAGQTHFLFGGASTYRHPEPIYFDQPGAYRIRYCDRWKTGGHENKICSNTLEVRVGVGSAGNDGK